MSAASPFLDDPELRARISPLSVEEYQKMPEFNVNHKRTELIRGVVFEKMSKSPLHSRIGSRLYDLLRVHVPENYWLRKEEPLQLPDSVPEPDVSLVAGKPEDFDDAHPATALLAVEVAVTTIAADRALALIYAEANVAECWIVLARNKEVEIYRNPSNGRYLERIVLTLGSQLSCEAIPSLAIPVDAIFV